MIKISFCTVCMNRLHQLKETILANITCYQDVPGVEFILLNYNSSDEMDDWVLCNLKRFIDIGLLIYYKTTEPESFNHSHSKNMIFKLATGDILCSINADHYIGEGFDLYLRKLFCDQPNSYVTPYLKVTANSKNTVAGDVFGKVCVWNTDFHKIGGFDEKFKIYGFEDLDLINRLDSVGSKRVVLNDPEFLKFISHHDDERIPLKSSKLYAIYIQYVSPSASEVIYFSSDHSYEQITLKKVGSLNSEKYTYAFKKRDHVYHYAVEKGGWKKGKWEIEKDKFILSRRNTAVFYRIEGEQLIDLENQTFFKIQQVENISKLNTLRSFLKNLHIMKMNVLKKISVVNNSSYGKGVVLKNFGDEYFNV